MPAPATAPERGSVIGGGLHHELGRDVQVGPRTPGLGIGQPGAHGVADTPRSGHQRPKIDGVVGGGGDDRLVTVGVAPHEGPGAVELRPKDEIAVLQVRPELAAGKRPIICRLDRIERRAEDGV